MKHATAIKNTRPDTETELFYRFPHHVSISRRNEVMSTCIETHEWPDGIPAIGEEFEMFYVNHRTAGPAERVQP